MRFMAAIGSPDRGLPDAAVTPTGARIETVGTVVAGRTLDHRVAYAAPGEVRLGGGQQGFGKAGATRLGGDEELVDFVAFDGGKSQDTIVRFGDEAAGFERPKAAIEALRRPLGNHVRWQDRRVAIVPGVVPQPDDRGAVI